MARVRSWLRLSTVVLCVAILVATVPMPVLANPGADSPSDAVLEYLPIAGANGSLDSTSTDWHDMYKVYLTVGQTIDCSMTVTSAETSDTDFDLAIFKPGTTSVGRSSRPWMWGKGHLYEHFTFMAPVNGYYYIDVSAYSGKGSYQLDTRFTNTVNFKFTNFVVPKSAKKGKGVKVSIKSTPSYNGPYSPIWFHFYRYEGGKWKQKKLLGANGTGISEASATFWISYKFPKTGKWRVRAEFWDEAHQGGWMSKPLPITIK